MKTIF